MHDVCERGYDAMLGFLIWEASPSMLGPTECHLKPCSLMHGVELLTCSIDAASTSRRQAVKLIEMNCLIAPPSGWRFTLTDLPSSHPVA